MNQDGNAANGSSSASAPVGSGSLPKHASGVEQWDGRAGHLGRIIRSTPAPWQSPRDHRPAPLPARERCSSRPLAADRRVAIAGSAAAMVLAWPGHRHWPAVERSALFSSGGVLRRPWPASRTIAGTLFATTFRFRGGRL